MAFNPSKFLEIIFRLPLISKKAERFENSLVLLGVTLLWHVAEWVSRAPPHHTLPAFLNLNGTKSEQSRWTQISRKHRFTVLKNLGDCDLVGPLDRILAQLLWFASTRELAS